MRYGKPDIYRLVIISTILILIPHSIQGATYEYDALNRLVYVAYDSGISIEYSYDTAGNRTRYVSTLIADSSINGRVDFQDFAVLASRWLDQACSSGNNWCEEADINHSGQANIQDLAAIAQQWLESIGP